MAELQALMAINGNSDGGDIAHGFFDPQKMYVDRSFSDVMMMPRSLCRCHVISFRDGLLYDTYAFWIRAYHVHENIVCHFGTLVCTTSYCADLVSSQGIRQCRSYIRHHRMLLSRNNHEGVDSFCFS